MTLAIIKGMIIEITMLGIILFTLIGITIYLQSGSRLQQSLESINKQLQGLGGQYQKYENRLKILEKQFFYLKSLKKSHNHDISESDINKILTTHSKSYSIKYSDNKKTLASKNNQPTWITEDIKIKFSIKHELALMQLFDDLQQRFSVYLELENCNIKRISNNNSVADVSHLRVLCGFKLSTLS